MKILNGAKVLNAFVAIIAITTALLFFLYARVERFEGPTPNVMSGPLIVGSLPIVSVNVDDAGNAVYLAYDAAGGAYTKMVNSNGVAKYYSGVPSSYVPSSWSTYPNPAISNGYVVSYVPPPPPAALPPVPTATSLEASAIPKNPMGGPIPPACMPGGRVPGFPSADNRVRLYNQGTCTAMGGNHISNGECLRKAGGSFSWDCRGLNPIPQEEQCMALYPPRQ